jgi:hypothetical protein
MKEFKKFTDTVHMAWVFQEQLPEFSGGNLAITHCQILHTRYRAYVKEKHRAQSFLTACYRLEVAERSTQRHGEQVLFVKACLDNRSQAEFDKAGALPLAAPRFGRPLVHLPALDAVVWAFPNDPELPHLPEVMDPQRMTHYLPYHRLPAGFNTPQDIAAVEVEVVHYYPEERCTTRYTLHRGAPARPQTLTLFGKTFKDCVGEEIYRRLEYLWRQSQAEPTGFVVAQPLAYDETVHTIWQASLPGVPLIDLIDRGNYRKLLAEVARGLAGIHRSNLPSAVRETLDGHLATIRHKTEKLIHAFPQFTAPLQSLVQSLEESMPQLPATPDRLIHGDFHLRQFLVHEGQIVFFDFDEFAMGDPMRDLASFIVDLHVHGFAPDLVQEMTAVFCEAYRAQVNWDVPVDRLAWYLRLLFITKAYRSYRQQRPGLEDDIQHFITLAQGI